MIYENKFIRNGMNKRGAVAIFSIIIFVVIALLGIYLFLNIPIPAFAKLRNLINYFIIVIVWLVLQVGLIYGYYHLGKFATKGFYLYKNKIQMGTINVKNFLLSKS